MYNTEYDKNYENMHSEQRKEKTFFNISQSS